MAASAASDGFELNLTPLLDVVLQLIMFFMVCVKFTVGNPNVFAAETDNTTLQQAMNDKGKLVLNIFAVREVKGYDPRGQPIKTLVAEVPSEEGQPITLGQITVILFPDPDQPEIILLEGLSGQLTDSVRRDVVAYLRGRNLIEPRPADSRKPPIVINDPEEARVAGQRMIVDTARNLRIQAGRAADDRSEELKALAVLRVDRETTFGLIHMLVQQFDVEKMKTEVRVVTIAQ